MKNTNRPFTWLSRVSIFILVLISVSCSRTEEPEPPEPTPTRIEETAVPTVEIQATSTPTRVPLPTGLIRMAVPDGARETAKSLLSAAHPPNDYYRLAKELQGIDPSTIVPDVQNEYQVNDRTNFNIVVNPRFFGYKSLPSRLRHISDNAAWWASIDVRLDDRDIEGLAQRFEEQVLPINQQLFGKEWSPGIDGDRRVHFLLVQEEIWGSFFGTFSMINEYPRAIFPNSNEREMLVINVGSASIDSEIFASKLAHEHQHLIHWNQDPNEDSWFNEAMGELVTQAGGSVFGESNEIHFSENPNVQLTSRPERSLGDEDISTFAHYAAERQFAIYLLEQFGPQFINSVVHNPDPGVNAIQIELDELEGSPQFNDVFANWMIANFLDMPAVMEGQFGYENIDTISPIPEVINSRSTDTIQERLPPYGAHYYQINSNEPVKLTFSGSTLARLTPIDPYAGNYVWYSNRGDETTFSLTRSFDLSGVSSATLKYKVWYELDNRYDFAYLEISTDGENWTILETTHGTDENPYGRSYGIGYSGSSVDWKDEAIDLTPYVGQPVQIRFEVISDFTVNRDGFQLDNIEIPEIGFFDGAEDDLGGWEAQGFIRSTNLVPVEWIVWLVTPGPNIERIEIAPDQSATYEMGGFGTDYNFALLVISPTAPVSTMEINYEFVLEH
jgi:hypothetical protein